MKVETKRKEKEFEPIELTITIQNKDELLSLLCRTSAFGDKVYNSLSDDFIDDLSKESKTELSYINECSELFEVLVLYSNEYGLTKKNN